MRKIGLDFGTTNSILSYCDDKTFKTYRMNDAGATDYIPSFVSYDKEGKSIYIGRTSRLLIRDENYQTYSRFKIFLGVQDPDMLRQHNYGTRTPAEVAKDYIKRLLESYESEQSLTQPLEEVVITVPEIWVQEQQHLAREELKKICAELGLHLKVFLSEPVAAAVYFCYSLQKRQGKTFQGHLLVCDCGGGTLDLSLCRAEPLKKITILERTGKGHSVDTVGKAGMAFDERVIFEVYRRAHKKALSRSDPDYYRLMDDFEDKKINLKIEFDKSLEQYVKRPSSDRILFKLLDDEQLSIKSSDLADAFKKEIEPELTAALEKMQEYIFKNKINIQDPKRFRILLVGGFSNFLLVEKTIKDFFKIEFDKDERLASYFSKEDKALAIAKGAAVVANGEYEIITTCPISVGIRALSDEYGPLGIVDQPILMKGEKISEYKEPRYHKAQFGFFEDAHTSNKLSMVIFTGDGKDRLYLDLQKDLGGSIETLFPNLAPNKMEWKIGFSVDEDLIFTLHVKNQFDGNASAICLGDLLAKRSYPIASSAL